MKKEKKQILYIFTFLILGCVIGYFVAVTQMIPAGLIFFSHIAKKWLTSAAPKIIIGFLTWPIYTLAGAVGAIPLVVYLIYRLWKGRISYQKYK